MAIRLVSWFNGNEDSNNSGGGAINGGTNMSLDTVHNLPAQCTPDTLILEHGSNMAVLPTDSNVEITQRMADALKLKEIEEKQKTENYKIAIPSTGAIISSQLERNTVLMDTQRELMPVVYKNQEARSKLAQKAHELAPKYDQLRSTYARGAEVAKSTTAANRQSKGY